MGRVIYNNQRIIPAPLFSMEKSYQKTQDGTIIGAGFKGSINGQICAYKGSPTSSGTFWTNTGYPPDENISLDSRLGAILRKQSAIRELFSRDGMTMEIQSDDGTQPLKFNPRILSINTPEGPWHTLAPYSVEFEMDRVYPQNEDADTLPSGYFVSDASESWQLETDETGENVHLPRTYRITHSISAQGKRTYDTVGGLQKQAWENAKAFVLPRLGLDNTFVNSSAVNNLPSYYGGYNRVISETVDELGGTYAVQETWVLTSGTAIEDFTINTNYSIQDALTKVTVDGNIRGLEQRDSNMNLTTSKYTNALTKWSAVQSDLFLRAQSYSGTSLNISPVTTTTGRNPIAGTISYSYEYNNRPSNVISGALSENISITEQGYSQKFAAIGVLGRVRGPVLQDLSESDAISRTLNIDAVFPLTQLNVSSYSTIQNSLLINPRLNPAYSAVIENIIAAVNPINQGASKSFRSQPQESWTPTGGSYNYNITYTYEW